MYFRKLYNYGFLFLLIILVSCQQKPVNEVDALFQRLSTSNDISVQKAEFTIDVMQPLDHFSKNSEQFPQRIYVKHVGFDRPVVLVTEGYGARDRRSELSELLNANEIRVEYRYFNTSRPDSLDWKYLTLEQAANDHHRIVEIFKKHYKGRWTNTGISKGGQSALVHRYFFPDDVDATVAYVAPLNLAEEDKRIYDFLDNKVGTKKDRERVTEFQRQLLKRRNEVIPEIKKYCDEKNLTFRKGLDHAYEFMVLELSFGFWQWGNGDTKILTKRNASPEELAKELIKSGGVGFFSDQDRVDDPFNYQAYTEMGMYGYKTEKFKDLLKFAKSDIVSNKEFVSQKLPEFKIEIMKKMSDWILDNGNNILYIYGSFDPWYATAVETGEKTNAVKMVLEGANHGTRIRHFEGEEKEKIYTALEDWLEVKINRSK